MDENIKIRAVKEEDFTFLIELFKEFAAFEKLPEKMVNSVDRMMLEKDFFHCFVAETNDKRIVGYVTYFFCYYTWIGKSLYMDDLYVKPDERGKGIGSLLINEVIGFAMKTKCHKLRWQVSNWNKPAINFYRSLGAEIDGTEQNCDLVLNV
jgi:GNAT superfamily N-acetyltransferase